MSRTLFAISFLSIVFCCSTDLRADGKLFRPANYNGSLEEQSQEAIIVFRPGTEDRSAVQDLILKIRVAGKTDDFAWVVPLPSQPETAAEDDALFRELFRYVQARKAQVRRSVKSDNKLGAAGGIEAAAENVEVLSREVVGSYDVAVVREKQAGTLNDWLVENGYQSLAGGDDVIGFYREKNYVFACAKVTDAALAKEGSADLHPLRFTFKTGGRDGIYFPMKMTGLQNDRFDVNLYVFYKAWLNDRLNKYGYTHRGFALNHRDWDTPRCKPNAGKTWSNPRNDPYLRDQSSQIPTVKRFFQRRHPGERFYLTNLQAFDLRPQEVRAWSDDLWLFPYYTNRQFVPYDARPGGSAAAAWE